MTNVTPLICSPSPRDIDIVKEGHETFKDIPHLWVKYWHPIEAYTIMRDFFLKHKEFTHLAIAPDDLVVTREHYESLVKTLEREDYPILSGVCNIDVSHPATLNICIDQIPNIIRKLRHHKWADVNKLPNEPIIKVKFAGFPFMFIRRDIVEQIPLEGDTKYDPNPTVKAREPNAFDLALCWECNQKNIPIYVDTHIRLVHLRNMEFGTTTGKQVDNIKTRKIKPRVIYQVGDQIEDHTDYYMQLMYELNQYNLNVYLKRYMKSIPTAKL